MNMIPIKYILNVILSKHYLQNHIQVISCRYFITLIKSRCPYLIQEVNLVLMPSTNLRRKLQSKYWPVKAPSPACKQRGSQPTMGSTIGCSVKKVLWKSTNLHSLDRDYHHRASLPGHTSRANVPLDRKSQRIAPQRRQTSSFWTYSSECQSTCTFCHNPHL